MFSKIIKKVRGFSSVELVIMVGFGALAAAALIFLATSPQYMASSQPTDVNVNIKVESASTVNKGAVATTTSTASRQTSAKAAYGDTKPDLTNIVGDTGDMLITVYPTGTAPVGYDSQDRENIQWAVDNVKEGGTVVLKQYKKDTSILTPFEFPVLPNPPPYPIPMTVGILVLRDVNIQGEYTHRESTGHGVLTGTTIRNGSEIFYVGERNVMKLPTPASVTIKDIRFDGFVGHAATYLASKGYSEVSGCSSVNYKIGWGPGFMGSWPVVVASYISPNFITGQMKFSNNYFGQPPMDSPHNNLAFHSFNTKADITIDNNYIEDTWWLGILVAQNMGMTTIANNTVNKSLDFYDGSKFRDGHGITVGGFPFSAWGTYIGSSVIKNNKVNISGTVTDNNPDGLSYSVGIGVGAYDSSQYTVAVPGDLYALVEGNTVIMNNGVKSALECSNACTNVTWQDNVVKGNAAYGISFERKVHNFFNPAFTAPVGPHDNYVMNNDFTEFDGTTAMTFVDQDSKKISFTNNDYGLSSGVAGALIFGDENKLTNENFHGDYTGKPDLPAVKFHYVSGDFESENNTVNALKNDKPLTGDAFCDQVWDVKFDELGLPSTNNILSSCAKVPADKIALARTRLQQKFCENSGGTWTGTCSCPAEFALDDKGRCGCPSEQYLDWKKPSNGCVSE